MSSKRNRHRPRRLRKPETQYEVNMEMASALAADIDAGGGPNLDRFLAYGSDVKAVLLAAMGFDLRIETPTLEQIAKHIHRVEQGLYFPGATKASFLADINADPGIDFPVDEETLRSTRASVAALPHDATCPAPLRGCTCGHDALVDLADAILELK